ncbi:cytochrome c biogenesis CcdA family protein [Kineococcus rhizosphaerae]|uniref:Cytochrome c-type biogenesis protein n=1 Tax=Kineococcus rhizosphaerae TaxID=559628 RepID=A0A2T0R5B3_9ACTN|nr:cytochrome c biogenesis protein CcdA [Kineococcus rhizosphaerae]PRY15958.1 cytochrome c-type biogenesis protein [Kineococcus rhizosphaerae]
MTLPDYVQHGPLLLAVPLAALAGLVSFLSPCVLPLVPGFLAYVTGLSGGNLEQQRRGRMFLGALLFVLGFSVVFVLISFTAGAVGDVLKQYQHGLQRLLGVVVLAGGLLLLFSPLWAQRELKVRWRPRAGLLGAPVLGFLFGLGWTPCIGPIFAAISAMAFTTGSGSRATGLGLVYCLGLGIPFVLVAVAYGRGMRVLGALRRHRVALDRFGAVLLIVIGLLLVTGQFQSLVSWMQAHLVSNFQPVI